MRMTVAELRGATRGKYNNAKTIYQGREYDSKKEAHRAWELDMLLKAKVIYSYEPQVKILINLNGVHICNYICDFVVHYPDGKIEYEDVKGFKTDIYKLKKKLVFAQYQIKIKEI